MILHIVNPNATELMTRAMVSALPPDLSAEHRIVQSTVHSAPPSIEGHSDEARAVPGMLDCIMQAEQLHGRVSAHVIACFDDPGLDAAREVASAPVVGLCESAFAAAARISRRYSVVTSLPRAVPIIEDLARRYGADVALRRVHAADVPVLDLETDPERALPRVAAAIRRVRDEDGADAVILGCAGMSSHLEQLSRDAGIPVIDGVEFACRIALALAASGLRTSRFGGYAAPRVKSALAVSA